MHHINVGFNKSQRLVVISGKIFVTKLQKHCYLIDPDFYSPRHSLANDLFSIMNFCEDAMTAEYSARTSIKPLQALTYDCGLITASAPSREERDQSSASSQYSLASQPSTASNSSMASPKLPPTPEAINSLSSQDLQIVKGFESPDMVHGFEITELSRSPSEHAQLENYVANYDMMPNFNLMGDDYLKFGSTAGLPCYPDSNSLVPKSEVPIFDGIPLNLHGSLGFDTFELNSLTQRRMTNNVLQSVPLMSTNEMVRTYMRPQAQASMSPMTLFESPTILKSQFDERGAITSFEDTTLRPSSLTTADGNDTSSAIECDERNLRLQRRRCREEKPNYTNEMKAPKFAAYKDVQEAVLKCVANELSRTKEKKLSLPNQDAMQVNARKGGLTSFLPSTSGSSQELTTGSSKSFSLLSTPICSSTPSEAKRSRRRSQVKSTKIPIHSSDLELTYIERKEPSKKFPCSKCGQEYSRREHMTRHLRGHEGRDRVICPIKNCRRMIKRADNLIQHLAIHLKVGKKTRRPDKRISVEAMNALIREYAGSRERAEHMIKRVDAARLKMNMVDYYEMYGRKVGELGSQSSRGQSKL